MRVRVKRINYKYIVKESLIQNDLVIYIEGRLVYGDFEDICQFFRDNPDFKFYAFEDTVKRGQEIHFEGGQFHVK